MRPYLRYQISQVYKFIEREFQSVWTLLVLIILFYYAVCVILTILHVEPRRAAMRAQHQQRNGDSEHIERRANRNVYLP